MKFTNAVEPAANARVWGKGVPGKCFGGTNFEIPEWMYTRELAELEEVKAHDQDA